jgi:hypothetical protein
MSDSVAVPQSMRLPVVSFGPFRLMEAVPWLMFATAMRIIQSMGGLQALLAAVCSDLSIFLAFLLAARRMIEFADGKTGLGKLSFTEQMILARKAMVPVLLMMLAGSFAMIAIGARWTGVQMLNGFDAIAFDQFIAPEMVWSAFLAVVTLLMLLAVESNGNANLFAALKELWQRSLFMVPAIVAVTAAHIGLSVVQGLVRGVVYMFWHSTATPQLGRTLVYFLFIFGFASVRLWVTLAILTFALRESYRRGHAAPTLGASLERP